MHWPPLPPENISGTYFCHRLSRPQGHSTAGRIMSIKNSNDTIENRSCNLPICITVPQPLHYCVPHVTIIYFYNCTTEWHCEILQVELSRLRWAGHVTRQDDDDLARRVLLSEPGVKRPRERPRLHWEDGVKEDEAKLGCRNWTVVALNQEGWRKLLKEAAAHSGL
jgi:hypothetical protein